MKAQQLILITEFSTLNVVEQHSLGTCTCGYQPANNNNSALCSIRPHWNYMHDMIMFFLLMTFSWLPKRHNDILIPIKPFLFFSPRSLRLQEQSLHKDFSGKEQIFFFLSNKLRMGYEKVIDNERNALCFTNSNILCW